MTFYITEMSSTVQKDWSDINNILTQSHSCIKPLCIQCPKAYRRHQVSQMCLTNLVKTSWLPLPTFDESNCQLLTVTKGSNCSFLWGRGKLFLGTLTKEAALFSLPLLRGLPEASPSIASQEVSLWLHNLGSSQSLTSLTPLLRAPFWGSAPRKKGVIFFF